MLEVEKCCLDWVPNLMISLTYFNGQCILTGIELHSSFLKMIRFLLFPGNTDQNVCGPCRKAVSYLLPLSVTYFWICMLNEYPDSRKMTHEKKETFTIWVYQSLWAVFLLTERSKVETIKLNINLE